MKTANHMRTISAYPRQFMNICFALLAAVLFMTSDAAAQPPTEIAIEIDYMVLRDSLDRIIHTHKPQPDEIEAVEQMFACRGITCHLIVDDEVPHIEVLQRDPQNASNFFDYYGPDSFGSLKEAYRDYGECWHYCIFAHRYQNNEYATSGSSGLAEIAGDDFIVTLGGWTDSVGTPFERAALLAHELGHNLGLHHVNQLDADIAGPYTPNYPSIMSYFCCLYGVRSRYIEMGLSQQAANLLKDLDYSDGYMCTLLESSLDERLGVGMKKVDWDCDGFVDIANVAQDLDSDNREPWCASTGTMSLLHDYSDWTAMRDHACDQSKDALEVTPTISCVTYDEHLQFVSEHKSILPPPLIVEPCVEGRMRFVAPGVEHEGTGQCDNPHLGLVPAQTYSDPGDVLFLKYGTYDEPYESILLNKRLLITATSHALIRPVGAGKDTE